MTQPSRDNGYQVSDPFGTYLTADLWNLVLGDLHVRLEAREALEASFEALEAQGIQASLDYIQATVAPQLEDLQTGVQAAQAQIDQIVIDGISPDAAKLGGHLPGHYATAQALTDGLAGRVPTSRTVNGRPLSADVAIVKADVGLGNADNTRDADKPVSSAQRTALEAMRFRNLITNGTFRVNQRGVSGTVTLAAGAYAHDRWKAGAGGCTYSVSKTEGVTTLTITAGTLVQVIDGSEIIGSGTHALSWTGTAQGRVNGGTYGASGMTATLTGGANARVEFGTGTLALPQLERGANATPFERVRAAEERAECARYYQRFHYRTRFEAVAAGGADGRILPFPTPMRVTPTASIVNVAESDNVSAVSVVGHTEQSFHVEVTPATGSGGVGWGAVIEFRAEL